MFAEIDVAVVGAGAAGLAAGLHLKAAGARFVVLEAGSRIGGRAFTDTSSFAQHWDLGCHWLHSASVNPFRPIADRLGFRYGGPEAPTLVRRYRLGGRWADGTFAEACEAVDAAFEAVRAAGDQGLDVSAREVVPAGGPHEGLTELWFGLMTAAAVEDVSTRDFAAYSDTDENWPVVGGYGALVAANAADLKVALGCPVTAIDRSGRRVRLTTPLGAIEARCVILTVPTSVLAKGGIAFTPSLPANLEEAFHALPLGAAEKVAFGFDRDVFGIETRTSVAVVDPTRPERVPANLLLLPGPQPMAIAHLGGPRAGALVEAGPEALTEMALAALMDAFGSDIRARVTGTRATGWLADPFIGGGYSCALPGKAHLRARLAAPVDDRLFFAGEATSAHAFSTCHGAHLSGIEAARRALHRLSEAA